MKRIPAVVTVIFIALAVLLAASGHWTGLAVFAAAGLLLLLLFSRTLARFALDRRARLNLTQYFDYEREHEFPAFRRSAPLLMEGREEWEMTSRDGLRLKAGFHPGVSHEYAVLCHGYGNDGLDGMCVYAEPYIKAGWNVLTPYARGHGPSQGRYIGMGWKERLDIADWCQRIRQRDPQASVVLHGVSMGGATVLNAAGENPPGVFAVVADCGYTNLYDQFAAQARAMFGLRPFPILNIASVMAAPWLGASFREADTTAQTARAKMPILFIHGARDTFVPFSMLETNWNACVTHKEKIVVPTAAHANSVYEDPEYGKKVLDFVERMRAGQTEL